MSDESIMAPNDNVGDEMAGLFSLMQQKMEEEPQLLSSSAGKRECCIFRVPRNLLKINEQAYYPYVVSIGPYHYGEERLQMLQERKWKFLSSLLDRCTPYGIHLQMLIDAVLPEEERIRESYWECIDKFSRSELVMMMVLDGCFIIELLAMFGNLVQHEEAIFNVTWIFPAVLQDLYKLENQIPYFVLEKLFEITTASLAFTAAKTTLAGLALDFFSMTMQRPSDVINFYTDRINTQTAPVKHLLELYWRSFMPPPLDENYKKKDDQNHPVPQLIRSTLVLRKAGIKFRQKITANSFLEINFNKGKGTLEIPFFVVDDYTHNLLLNFIAFEQCYGHYPQQITSFALFMNCLINSPADSEYLQSKQIIENFVGTHEEVVRFFNQIGKNVDLRIKEIYLATVFEGINKYSNNKWRVGWGDIKHKYFGAPWAWIAALGALIGLLLTATQTVFTVLGYLNLPK